MFRFCKPFSWPINIDIAENTYVTKFSLSLSLTLCVPRALCTNRSCCHSDFSGQIVVIKIWSRSNFYQSFPKKQKLLFFLSIFTCCRVVLCAVLLFFIIFNWFSVFLLFQLHCEKFKPKPGKCGEPYYSHSSTIHSTTAALLFFVTTISNIYPILKFIPTVF